MSARASSGVDLKPGQRLGPYRIDAVLGRGGMGVVYRAFDERQRLPVALKTLLGPAPGEAADPTQAQRFLREARTAASVRHDHVVSVLFAGELGGLRVLVQELVPGGSLSDQLRKSGPLPWRDAARLGAQVARGLAAIHAAGLVHRDLKPANVLLDAGGAAKISDFGLARRVDRSSIALTKSGEMVGTLEYLAPEQAGDSKEVGPAVDLYALGGTLHALLTGRPPFEGQGVAVITKHLREPARAPSALVPDVPRGLDRLVLQLLEKDPAARPTATDAARALDELLAVRTEREAVAPSKGPLVAGAVVVIGVTLGLGYWLGNRAQQPALTVTESRPTATERPPEPATETPTVTEPPTPARDLVAEARERFPDTPKLRLVRLLGDLDLKSPTDLITVAVTDDGRYVSGGGGVLRVFELATGRQLAATATSWVSACAALPGGFVVTAGDELLVWDLATLTVVQRLEAPAGRVEQVSVSSDGARVLFGSDTKVVRVVDARTSTVVATLPAGTCAALSPDGRLAFVGGADGRVHEVEVDAPTRSRDLGVAGASVSALGPSPDGRWLLVGSDAGDVSLVELKTPRVVVRERVFDLRVGSVAVAPSSSRAVVTCFDAINPASGRVSSHRDGLLVDLGPDGLARGPVLAGHDYMLWSAAFTPDGRRVVTASFDHTARVFDAATGAPVLSPRGHAAWVVSAALSPDGRTLATRGMDSTLRLWDTATGAERAVVKAHTTWSPVVTWSSDGKELLTADGWHELVLWNVDATGPPRERVRFEPTGPEDGKISCAGFVGTRVLIGTESGPGARLWERRDGARDVTALPVHGAALSCAPWEADQLLVGTSEAALMCVDLRGSQPDVRAVTSFLLADAPEYPAMNQLVTNVERRVAVGQLMGGRLGFWHEGRTTPLLASAPQGRWMRGVAVEPGRSPRHAASTSEDGALCLWDLDTGERLDSFRGTHEECPTGVAFSLDGKRLYVGTYSGVVLELEVR